MPSSDVIVDAQQTSLDDTDCYASVWEDILQSQQSPTDCSHESSQSRSLWGGRGKGGRGLSRRTIQPKDVIVEDVRLQYLLGDLCLEGATLKLLHGHVYALVGKNGCGKSTLIRRMHAQKIPGWSTKWSTLYLPPEMSTNQLDLTPIQVVLEYHKEVHQHSTSSTQSRIDELEAMLDALNVEEEQDEMERICEELSNLEDQLQTDTSDGSVQEQAREALLEFGMDIATMTQKKCSELSRGQQKSVLLSVALVCSSTNLLLLDEPTNHLDVFQLIQLRRVIETCESTVVLVSHDVDLINDVATDIIDMEGQKLWYFPGNYDSYKLMKDQQGMHELRQSVAMEKKRDHLKSTLQRLKEKPVPKRGGAKKKSKMISSQRKKIDRHDALGKTSSMNAPPSIGPAARKGLTPTQRVKLAELLKTIPDKAIQFVFPENKCTWGEPLISALDVGHGYDPDVMHSSETKTPVDDDDDEFRIVRRPGYLFDCVDWCIEEGSRNCILGPTASGKSTLLKIMAKRIPPVEGTVHHASGVRVGYFDAEVVDAMIDGISETTTALDYFRDKQPTRTEKDLRGHLTAFGLPPSTQAKTPVCCLSSGEKCRFVLASIMLDNPPMLCMDNPTSHLDVESVQALIYGLRQWNGTLVMVSQDANFLRSLEDVKCVVIMPNEGKLRRVEGGMDSYLRSFQI